MKERAYENLKAAAMLAKDADVFPNAATTRAYYAAYLACWWQLNQKGERTPVTEDGDEYFPHKKIADLARRRCVLDDDLAEKLDYLRDQRVRADYYPDGVAPAEARAAVADAELLVSHLVGAWDDRS